MLYLVQYYWNILYINFEQKVLCSILWNKNIYLIFDFKFKSLEMEQDRRSRRGIHAWIAMSSYTQIFISNIFKYYIIWLSIKSITFGFSVIVKLSYRDAVIYMYMLYINLYIFYHIKNKMCRTTYIMQEVCCQLLWFTHTSQLVKIKIPILNLL